MVRGIRDRAVQAPGYGAFGSVQFNPATDRAIQQIREVGGVFALGTRFPFNDGSTDVVALNTGNLAGGKHTYDTFEINASQTITCTGSPVWIAARKVKLNTGAILTADGKGGTGASPSSVAGGASYVNAASYYGLAGGGGGGGGVRVTGTTAAGAGGKGYAGATAAAGGAGVVRAPGATAGNGSAGHAVRLGFEMLDTFIDVLKDAVGGAGGGSGGLSVDYDGGQGGNGGGIILITCEVFENDGTIRARGNAGSNGGGAVNDDPSGGGGGGGGGLILILCVQRLALGTIQVTGGAGGVGGDGSSGGDLYYAGDGGAGADGVAHIEQQYIA